MEEGQNDIYYIGGGSILPIAVIGEIVVIKNHFVKKCLNMVANIVENNDDNKKLYEQFGKCLNLVDDEDEQIIWWMSKITS